MSCRTKLINLIRAERQRQETIGFDEENDKKNTQKDWISYIGKYGYEAMFIDKNKFKENMIKVAALALAALEAHEKGYC